PPRPPAEGAQQQPARGHPGDRATPARRAAQAFRRPGRTARRGGRRDRPRRGRERCPCRADLRHTARVGIPRNPMTLTLPTWLTLLRIVLIPVLVLTFYLPWSWSNFASAALFALAAFTDWLDGWIARR